MAKFVKVKFTDTFFADQQNIPFLAAVVRDKAYTARKAASNTNYDYRVHVKGEFLVQAWCGFIYWHGVVPARADEVVVV